MVALEHWAKQALTTAPSDVGVATLLILQEMHLLSPSVEMVAEKKMVVGSTAQTQQPHQDHAKPGKRLVAHQWVVQRAESGEAGGAVRRVESGACNNPPVIDGTGAGGTNVCSGDGNSGVGGTDRGVGGTCREKASSTRA